jgi:hypothetical protein
MTFNLKGNYSAKRLERTQPACNEREARVNSILSGVNLLACCRKLARRLRALQSFSWLFLSKFKNFYLLRIENPLWRLT